MLKNFEIQTIYHAAAYKHVPLVESNKIASGASGANGGQVSGGMRKDQFYLEKAFGFEKAKALWSIGEEAKYHAKDLIDKYQIQPERNTNNKDICILSGIVSNYDINASEMMAILGSLEIFLHSVITTQQKIVIYTDSLIAKKVFSDKRRPPNTKLYEKLRDRFNQIIGSYRLDVIIKKVNAHVGIELNEIADATAKDRLRRIL
mgnify:CR=1 FL=1